MCPIIGYNGTNIVPIIGQISRVDLYVYQYGAKLSELSAEFDREPEKQFNYRDEADSKAESTNPTKA